jgi:hypothetical protein
MNFLIKKRKLIIKKENLIFKILKFRKTKFIKIHNSFFYEIIFIKVKIDLIIFNLKSKKILLYKIREEDTIK